nr:hypothetical protein [Desulfobacula sp.]
MTGFSYLGLGSPYVNGYLEPGAEKVMLLETQRGCPYQCGFCYYHKSRKTRSASGDGIVLDGVAYALEQGVEEVYLLDPSLNSRPGLPALLEKMAGLNRAGKVSLPVRSGPNPWMKSWPKGSRRRGSGALKWGFRVPIPRP